MRKDTQSEAGFTLMETLVAFAIFSLSVVAILQSLSLSSRMQARAQSAAESGEILSRLLTTADIELGRSGSLEGGENGFEWQVSVSPAADGLSRITARVTDPFGRTETATTLRWQGELIANGAS